ncbi:phospholipid transporting ATPase, partial [Coemansia nantahalensis]
IIPFTISNVLLRGMTVRNTDWLVGLVMYTGDQTKIVLNSGPSPYKRSRIERVMNVQVFISFGMVFALSFVVAVIGGQRYASSNQRSSPYLNSSSSTGLYGLALFWSAMIMLQNIIPIALYVSIEFVKSWHAYWIYEDIDMYYEPTDQRCVARNWNISDDLGQVSYIFSDKTGTLTRNVMDFRMCSINGVIYGKQLPGDELDVVKGRMAQEEVDRNNPPEGGANPFFMEIQDDEDRAATAVAAGFDGSLQSPVARRMGDNGVSLEEGRLSISSSIASNGTDQCDNSPLITTSVVSGRSKTYAPLPAPAPAPLPIDAARSRARTEQSMSDEEIQAKRKRMIHTYLSAMRGVFDPVYVEVGDEETGEGGSYTFVDPQIFYDMRPEVAPAGRVKGMASPRADAAARVEGSGGSGPDGAGLGLAVPFEPVRRIASHRSVHHGFDVDPLRQRDAIDLFLTQVATCHSVVVEKSFQKQIIDDDRDDRSTIRRLARIFHGRSGSRKITERVLHMRNRSRQHRRTESAATASSFGGGGDDVEWAPPDNGPMSAGHARNASMAVGGSLRMADGGPSPPRHARNMSLMDAASYSATAPARRGSGLVTDVRTSFPGAPRSAESGEVPGFFDAPLSGEPATHSPLSAHSRSQSPVPLHMQATAEGDALAGSQLMSPEGHTPQKDMSRLAYSAE